MIETIHSIKDEKIERARAVKSRKGRLELQRLLLEGEEILDWALEHSLAIEYLLLSDKAAPALAPKYLSRGLKVFSTSEGILKKVTDTAYVIPVLGVAHVPARPSSDRPEFVVVLDGVQDFGNIGTIIRTCQAFGIQHLLSTTADFDIYQRKTIEASRGSAFATTLEAFSTPAETLATLKKHGYQVVATSPRGSDLQSLAELRQQPVALIVGNETAGISPEIEKGADLLLQIPMSPAVESLNVGVAAGISIYELKLKQVLAMIEQHIKSTLGRELNVAGMLVQQALDAALRKVSNLSSQQVIFMMVLKCDGEMAVEQMGRQFGILESETQAFLAPLVEAALITRQERLTLTPKGEEVLAKLWFTVESTEKSILSAFSPQEASTLRRQLRLVQSRCVQLIEP